MFITVSLVNHVEGKLLNPYSWGFLKVYPIVPPPASFTGIIPFCNSSCLLFSISAFLASISSVIGADVGVGCCLGFLTGLAVVAFCTGLTLAKLVSKVIVGCIVYTHFGSSSVPMLIDRILDS